MTRWSDKGKLVSLLLAGILWLFAVSCTDSDSTITRPRETDPFFGQGRYEGEYWPTSEWRECHPSEVGMNASMLYKAYEYAANPNISTDGIIIIKDGYIVGEAYFGNFTEDSYHQSFSVAKSFTSALIGIAIDKGMLNSVNEAVYQFYPEWQAPTTPPLKKLISIKHLLTMMGGIQWQEGDYYNPYSQDDIPIMYRTSSDFIQYVLNKPMAAEPGTRWYYSSGETILLSGIIEAVTGEVAFLFARDHLLNPIGIVDILWESDPSGHTITGWGIGTTVRNYARFGYLYLNNGMWDGEQIISESWIEESTGPFSSLVNHYAYLWWLPQAFGSYGDVDIPPRTYMALGIYIQRLYVVPEENLVVVRVGTDAGDVGDNWDSLKFLELITDAIIEESQ